MPAAVVTAEAYGDPPGLVVHPEEVAAVARAVASRRREFATARQCARDALARLGVPPVPIPRGDGGAPRWPAGVVGSITHCAGYRAAAVARTSDLVTLGIDAEPASELPADVLGLIATPAERGHLSELAAAEPCLPWDRLLFCAKEAVYKAWSPLTGRFLDFTEARVTFDPAANTFTARLLVPDARVAGRDLGTFTGRYARHDGLIAAAVALT